MYQAPRDRGHHDEKASNTKISRMVSVFALISTSVEITHIHEEEVVHVVALVGVYNVSKLILLKTRERF